MAGGLAPAASADSPVVHPFATSIGGFTDPRSVAVDDSGHVYVLDRVGSNTISKFDFAGNPVDFSALGTNTIGGNLFPENPQVAVDNSGGVADGDIYVTTLDGLAIYSADGTRLGALTEIPNQPINSPQGVAVDPAGTVYVRTGRNAVEINRFVPTANPPTNDDFDAQLVIRCCSEPATNLAADSAGDVYATGRTLPGIPEEVLRKYTPGQFGHTASGDVFTFDTRAVAVDPQDDDVYVAKKSEIAVFDRSGDARGTFGAGHVDEPLGVAVDAAGNVFVANPSAGTVSVFGPALTLPDVSDGRADGIDNTSATLHGAVNPSGVAVTDCHFEYGKTTAYGQSAPCVPSPGSGSAKVDVSAAISGLEAATTYHFRLVATNANGTTEGADRTFDTAGVPGIADTRVARTGDASAVVKARINPHFAATTYHVEYGTTTAYGNSTAETPIGSDGASHGAAARLTGLEPGATYHFRFVATNSFGTTTGPDGSFSACHKPRIGPSAALPDCRAYEQVSPVDKNHTDVLSTIPSFSSADGNLVTFASAAPFANATSGPQTIGYAATRGVGAWTTHTISPRVESEDVTLGTSVTFVYGGSADFTRLMVSSDTALAPGAVDGNSNFYAYDTEGQSYELIDSSPFSNADFALSFAGASADGRRFVFSEFSFFVGSPSTPPPAPGAFQNLYQWSSAGGLELVGIMPNGDASPRGSVQAGTPFRAVANHAVSQDGERIYWKEQFSSGPVYLRDGNQTRVVSADQTDTPQVASFWYATPDGSKAFITSNSPLTADASAAGADLYRYDAASDRLTDLTPSTDPGGADVIGVFGASDDGDYVYFAARGALAPGATAGEANLYVWHDGETRFIGALASHADDVTGEIGRGIGSLWRVSPDGRGFGLLFRGEIAGPDPHPAHAFNQAYYYSYADDSLACASCPADRAPRGEASFAPTEAITGGAVLPNHFGSQPYAANGGRLFFSTTEALVPADVNGEPGCPVVPGGPSCQDVYEYVDGQAHLISTGQGSAPARLASVSKSGDDVFFYTYARLVGQDTDNNNDLYDARVGGGLASQNPPPEDAPCRGDACQGGPGAPPPPPEAGSSDFSGPGNAAEGEGASRRCARLGEKAEKKQRKAKRAKRAFKQAKRKARRADGKRARRLEKRAERKQERFKKKRRKARRAKRMARDCESPEAGRSSCERLERIADRAKRKARRLDRRAERADGKRARRLERRAERTRDRATRHRRRARSCDRGAK